ncbi:MAG: geranylgeranylglyceryl/heptaprenylglyceryl phosphate synthase [Bacteroidales bacterium]|jgi:phosphoglycerol geranylgeranyltransferase|nr:geranylgeranylglyceryl/heptaprenylglyceryl phosphate synthase [Bacteroidales bacterium]
MIYDSFTTDTKKLALLIDPDKYSVDNLTLISRLAESLQVDYIFVGGSILLSNIEHTIQYIQAYFQGPVLLFPGHANQVTNNADGILFLSLISGRNAEFLIGNQVISAPRIKQIGLEVIPTGYILIDCGCTTSVEYMSNTRPIPATKSDIVIATAMAGEMLGLKSLYLEGGSGAQTTVSTEIIEKVKKTCSIPIIVGGGIRTPEKLNEIYRSGADIAVIGNAIEDNQNLLQELVAVRNSFND